MRQWMATAVAIIATLVFAVFPIVGDVAFAKGGTGPGSSAGGGNNGQGGGGSHGGGIGGGDGGHGGGDHGGGGGGDHGGGGGDHGGGGTAGGGSAAPTVSISGQGSPSGAAIVTGGKGISKENLAKLVTDIKACEMERPNLAIGDYRASTGAWYFTTGDDTVWPYIYRCMKARGHQPDGPDYTEQTNFGTR